MTALSRLPEPLLSWYDTHHRDLPWRQEVSPYRTWVSEIMLQQTRVTAVIPYFERFMAAYPTVEALAAAPEEELMRLWQGLGYYSRARNLQKAAREIAARGGFPDAYEEVRALPGIGDYTAGAILSIAMGQPVPAVDGNVLRVAARITGSDANVLDEKTKKDCRAQMEAVIPRHRPGAFNQALMDLGAMVCLPGAPLCGECPACTFCVAHAQGREKELPVRLKKREKRREELTVFVLQKDGRAALRQRADRGLLAGLWEFPHVPGHLDEAQAAAQAARWGLQVTAWQRSLTAVHEFTHIRWEMVGYVLTVTGEGPEDWCWCGAEERDRRAIPSAFEKFVKELA